VVKRQRVANHISKEKKSQRLPNTIGFLIVAGLFLNAAIGFLQLAVGPARADTVPVSGLDNNFSSPSNPWAMFIVDGSRNDIRLVSTKDPLPVAIYPRSSK